MRLTLGTRPDILRDMRRVAYIEGAPSAPRSSSVRAGRESTDAEKAARVSGPGRKLSRTQARRLLFNPPRGPTPRPNGDPEEILGKRLLRLAERLAIWEVGAQRLGIPIPTEKDIRAQVQLVDSMAGDKREPEAQQVLDTIRARRSQALGYTTYDPEHPEKWVASLKRR